MLPTATEDDIPHQVRTFFQRLESLSFDGQFQVFWYSNILKGVAEGRNFLQVTPSFTVPDYWSAAIAADGLIELAQLVEAEEAVSYYQEMARDARRAMGEHWPLPLRSGLFSKKAIEEKLYKKQSTPERSVKISLEIGDRVGITGSTSVAHFQRIMPSTFEAIGGMERPGPGLRKAKTEPNFQGAIARFAASGKESISPHYSARQLDRTDQHSVRRASERDVQCMTLLQPWIGLPE